jgi:D-arginine utilization repressor
MKKELKQHLPTAEAIAKLLYPFAEVALHDLKKDRIEAIFNPISKRAIGDQSYLEGLDLNTTKKSPSIIGPYEKTNYDGRKLKSISISIHNDDKIPVGFLCINLDISVFDKYKNMLDLFLSPTEKKTKKETVDLFKNDLHEQINSFIQNYCIKNHLHLESLDRNEKKAIILQLKANGALNEINGPQYIARALNISRATVYNYLKQE